MLLIFDIRETRTGLMGSGSRRWRDRVSTIKVSADGCFVGNARLSRDASWWSETRYFRPRPRRRSTVSFVIPNGRSRQSYRDTRCARKVCKNIAHVGRGIPYHCGARLTFRDSLLLVFWRTAVRARRDDDRQSHSGRRSVERRCAGRIYSTGRATLHRGPTMFRCISGKLRHQFRGQKWLCDGYRQVYRRGDCTRESGISLVFDLETLICVSTVQC